MQPLLHKAIIMLFLNASSNQSENREEKVIFFTFPEKWNKIFY
jgi:hypothetical protein